MGVFRSVSQIEWLLDSILLIPRQIVIEVGIQKRLLRTDWLTCYGIDVCMNRFKSSKLDSDSVSTRVSISPIH